MDLLLSRIATDDDDEEDLRRTIACGAIVSHGLLEAERICNER
jgi:hypothetical protein